MGKNFSCNNSTGKRRKSDFYETPYSMTRHILNRLPIATNKTVLEPSCGNGAISKVLNEFGIKKSN
jgi:cyclopropane fatty-acyl-phospholipid synthase-like methyltransferase